MVLLTVASVGQRTYKRQSAGCPASFLNGGQPETSIPLKAKPHSVAPSFSFKPVEIHEEGEAQDPTKL